MAAPQQPGYREQNPRRSVFGGSTFLKFLFGLGIVVLVITFILVFVMGFSIQSIIMGIAGMALVGVLLFLAAYGLLYLIKRPAFSPQGSYRMHLVRNAIKGKPFNVNRVFLRGEDWRTQAFWGHVIGVGIAPYFAAKRKVDENGNPVYKKDDKGKDIEIEVKKGRKKIKKKLPEYEYLTEQDGDIVIVARRHGFPLNIVFRDVDIIRTNKKYCSDLLGDIYIKTVNLVNCGEYLYPYQQIMEDIPRIMVQHQSEVIVETYEEWLDLGHIVTNLSLDSSPTFQKYMRMKDENIAMPGLSQ